MTHPAQLLADLTGQLLMELPEGITATVILTIGDIDGFEVAMAGSTDPALLLQVLRASVERLEAASERMN